MDRAFEWDALEAAGNWRKHGVTFDHALKAFSDPFGVEIIDDRKGYDEERINLIGMCDGTILIVTYVERDDTTRIISARRAQRHEQDEYYRENSG